MCEERAAQQLRKVFEKLEYDSISNLSNKWSFLNEVIDVLMSLKNGQCDRTKKFLLECSSKKFSKDLPKRLFDLADMVTSSAEQHDKDAYYLRLSDLIRTLIAASLRNRVQDVILLADQKKAYYDLVRYFVEDKNFVSLYYDETRITYKDQRKMRNKAELAEEFFKRFRQDATGIWFRHPLWRRAIVHCYILMVIALTICCIVLNWGMRSSFLERIMDGVSIFTVLAVSVFGLLKLTSEDPTIIRHSIEGICYIHEVKSLCRALSIRYFIKYKELAMFTEDDVKSVLTCWKEPLTWLHANTACFTGVDMGGNFQLPGGLRVSEALSRGILISQRRICGIRDRVKAISRSHHYSENRCWLHVKDEGPNVTDDGELLRLIIG